MSTSISTSIVDADPRRRLARAPRPAPDRPPRRAIRARRARATSRAILRRLDDLVGDQDVVDPGRDHRLGLADRGAGDADRRPAELPPRQLRRAMRLDVRPERLAGALRAAPPWPRRSPRRRRGRRPAPASRGRVDGAGWWRDGGGRHHALGPSAGAQPRADAGVERRRARRRARSGATTRDELGDRRRDRLVDARRRRRPGSRRRTRPARPGRRPRPGCRSGRPSAASTRRSATRRRSPGSRRGSMPRRRSRSRLSENSQAIPSSSARTMSTGGRGQGHARRTSRRSRASPATCGSGVKRRVGEDVARARARRRPGPPRGRGSRGAAGRAPSRRRSSRWGS